MVAAPTGQRIWGPLEAHQQTASALLPLFFMPLNLLTSDLSLSSQALPFMHSRSYHHLFSHMLPFLTAQKESDSRSN